MACDKFLLLWRRMSCHRCVPRLVKACWSSDKRVWLTPLLFAVIITLFFFMWLLFNGTANKVEYMVRLQEAGAYCVGTRTACYLTFNDNFMQL